MGTNKEKPKTDTLESIIEQGPPKGRKSKRAEKLIESIGDDIDREYPEYLKRQRWRNKCVN